MNKLSHAVSRGTTLGQQQNPYYDPSPERNWLFSTKVIAKYLEVPWPEASLGPHVIICFAFKQLSFSSCALGTVFLYQLALKHLK